MKMRFLGLAIVVGCAACGAHSESGPRARSEFTARDAMLFEDGVDLIETPEQLEGQWRGDWDRDLGERVGQSDLVTVGTVTAVRVDVDPEHRTSYEVVLSVENTLVGKAPGSELNLVSHPGAPGYATLGEQKERLLNRKFVAFVRYVAGQTTESGGGISHFHLSPPSKLVMDRVDQHETRTQPGRIRVIEHTQKP